MSAHRTKDGTILLVDDDDMVRELIGKCLTASGYEVIEANGGAQAIELFQKHQEKITLVVSDIVMPGLFGDQLALRLTEMRPGLPFVLISGNPPDSLETSFALVEGQNFLRKPFQIDSLRECVASQIRETAGNQRVQ